MSIAASYHVETCIVGAGVVGLACARALSKAGKEVLVIERESTFGSGEHHCIEQDYFSWTYYT